MLHTILVPLDGTPFGELAMPYARRLAELSQARIVLLKAAPYHAVPMVGAGRGRLPVDEARVYLDGWRQKLALDGIAVDVEALHTDPVQVIRCSTRVTPPDLLVMSTHGRKGIGRALLGSISEDVLHMIGAPTLLVRPGSAGWTGHGPRSVLVPLDGSPGAERVLRVIEQLQLHEDTVIHVMHVVPSAFANSRTLVMSAASADMEALARRGAREVGIEARRYLESVALTLRGTWPVRTHLCEGDASYEILRVAELESCDLISMTTNGGSDAGSTAFGTVFTDVLHASQAPVLAVHSSH